MTGAEVRLPTPERSLPREHVFKMLQGMRGVGMILERSNPSTERTISGGQSTGTIVTTADLESSDVLLKIARADYPASFSEEDDPRGRDGQFGRLDTVLNRKGHWMVDPIDGTGDRKFGLPETPERKGFSILSSFIKDNQIITSIAMRPAYHQALAHIEGRTLLIDTSEALQGRRSVDITQASREAVREKISLDDPDVVRVNVRQAYPQTHLPDDFWSFATELIGVRFEEVRGGGAGDSLSKLVLGELDLVVARVGDWKSWDTGPFDPMIQKLKGSITDCDGEALGGYDREDLWHHRGVVASLGEKGKLGHAALLRAMQEYKAQKGIDLVISPGKS